MHDDIYKEIRRDYDRNQLKAHDLLKKRLKEVYAAFPRIKEIDEELTFTGIAITKAALNNNLAEIDAVKKRNKDVIDEKNDILANSDFPPDYLTNVYGCNKCKDTGYINSNKCSCYTQKIIEKYYSRSNLNNVLDEENFDNFDFRYYSDEKHPSEGLSPKNKMQFIYQKALDFSTNFEEDYTNLLFHGEVGLGKTFLCNCIAREVLNNGHSVLYLTAHSLFKIIEDARFNRDDMENPEEQISFIYEADLLIIDDLGTEFDTLVTQTALFNILNNRILTKKPMVISTNMDLNILEEKYTERIMSRVLGNFAYCKFFGDDIRKLKKYKTFS